MKIERYSGNEIFEFNTVEFNGEIPDCNFRKLNETVPRFGWYGYLKEPQGLEFRYWRHYGPRAFEIHVRCGFVKNEQGNCIYSQDDDLFELSDVFQIALDSTLSWPIHQTAIVLDPLRTLTFAWDQHKDSLQLLAHMLVSNIIIDKEKTEQKH